MLYKILKPDFKHLDERGGLVQLVRAGYSQVNYIYSVKACERGNHYHRLNKEAFYIIRGRITIKLEDVRTGEQDHFEVQAGDMFSIYPFVRHTFVYHEDTELISMYDIGVELADGEMDIYQEN